MLDIVEVAGLQFCLRLSSEISPWDLESCPRVTACPTRFWLESNAGGPPGSLQLDQSPKLDASNLKFAREILLNKLLGPIWVLDFRFTWVHWCWIPLIFDGWIFEVSNFKFLKLWQAIFLFRSSYSRSTINDFFRLWKGTPLCEAEEDAVSG